MNVPVFGILLPLFIRGILNLYSDTRWLNRTETLYSLVGFHGMFGIVIGSVSSPEMGFVFHLLVSQCCRILSMHNSYLLGA